MLIPQQKTSREIERYIPDQVFKIMCRYVVEERPETDSEYLFIRSIAPYEKDYVIKEEEAAVIRRIFDEYTGGKYKKEIAEGLNADGIPSPFGSVWNPSRINEILRREK